METSAAKRYLLPVIDLTERQLPLYFLPLTFCGKIFRIAYIFLMAKNALSYPFVYLPDNFLEV